MNHTTIQENARDIWGNSERVKSDYPETDEITFTAEEREGVLVPHHDALVISLTIANCLVKRILVDSGSSSNIIFQTAYQGLGLEEKALIRKANPLVRFSGEVKQTIGEVVLPVHTEGVSLPTRVLVVNCDSPLQHDLGPSVDSWNGSSSLDSPLDDKVSHSLGR